MGKIITYKNDNSKGKYCQIKFEDGKRILISMAQTGARVYKLKWGGLIPGAIIFDISTADLFSEKYRVARERLTEISLELDMLDVFRDVLLPLKSLKEAEEKLNHIFKV